MKDTEEATETALKYMEEQVPGLLKWGQNKALLELIAIGRQNGVNLLNVLHSMHQLFRMHRYFDPKDRDSENMLDTTASSWLEGCDGYLNGKDHEMRKRKEMVRRGMEDYNKRFGGVACSKVMDRRINDYLHCYIEYVLAVQAIIGNLIKKEYCPLQIDLVVIGKHHQHEEDTNEHQQKVNISSSDSDDEEDDDDDDDVKVNVSPRAKNVVNPWPEDIEGLLKKWKINYEKHEGSMSGGDWKNIKISRFIQKSMEKVLENKRNQRIILLIDRRSGTENIMIYQLPKHNAIRRDYCEEALSHMTGFGIIPNQEMESEDMAFPTSLLGAGKNVGGNMFVLSFRVHAVDKVSYEQVIKCQRMPFLPYHMVLIWPHYFGKGFNALDGKRFNHESIYKKWKLPLDRELPVWTKLLDPNLYELLKRNHLRYLQK